MASRKPENDDSKPGQTNGYLVVNGAGQATYGNQPNGDLTAIDASQVNISTHPGLLGQLPPEIEHITFGYLPISALVSRLVQETFNGFNDVINELSESSIPQINGAAPANTSQANANKKLRLMSFSQERRAQFIKILVLLQWSRQAESMSKVIDLKVWLDGQRRLFDDACNWMGELKRLIGLERTPNPDLKTALEALSLGKAPRLPDLNYLPPKPLSPQRLLKALRGINTQLSIRLHLHETIPPSLRDFSIANGRVTFRVPHGFELDLSIADDNPSSQLYFIEFRFLLPLTPAEIPQGRLRDDIEGRVNHLLGQGGLKECYNFLHDFVLSHKINTLKQQALRLSQENWSEHLKVEAVHRSLVIQYWVGRPGAKNWIEIGLRRRKAKGSSWLHKEENEPHIGLRWFRAGKEIDDVLVTMKPELLSVESILKQTISAHTNFIFEETIKKLKEGHLYSRKRLRLKQIRSVAEPIDSYLSIHLTKSQSCTVMQEPVSGRFALLPPSPLNSRAERELNNLSSPEQGASSRIAQLRVIAAYEEIEHTARCCGWDAVNSIRLNQDSLRHHFGHDTLKAGFLKKTSWDAQWLLAFTASLAEDAWWIVELVKGPSKLDQPVVGPSIRAAFKVAPLDSDAAMRELSLLELSRIERTAAGLISQFTDCRQMATQKIPHRLVKPMRSRSCSEQSTLYIHIPKDQTPQLLKSEGPATVPWANQVVRLSFIGVDTDSSLVSHLVVARTDCAALRSQRLSSMTGGSVSFHPQSGAFAFRLINPVGQSTIPAILDRLTRVDRLVTYVMTLQSLKMKTPDLSLDHVEFTYANKPQDYRAKISFPREAPPRLFFNHGNPHLRIRDQLTAVLRTRDGISHVIPYLQLSLPLMRVLAAIEVGHIDDRVAILPRSAEWYQIRYRSPPGKFDVRLRRRKESFMWFIQEMSLPNTEPQDQRVRDQLAGMLDGSGEGWVGVKPGIAATLAGVESLLQQIDKIFQQVPSGDPADTNSQHATNDQNDNRKGIKRKAEDDAVVILD
ncbi:MAG: hypothetical protein Q9181_000505 [Wetmoreana brouardii]